MVYKHHNLILPILIAILIFLILKLFIFDIYTIKENSMLPGLKSGTVILVFKAKYGIINPFNNKYLIRFSKQKKNDVVIFKKNNQKKIYIKRIAAIENDTIEKKNGIFYINKKKEQNSNILTNYIDNRYFKKLHIPNHTVFLMGDNRKMSYDSRDFGIISNQSILGKAIFKLFPLSQIGLVK